MIGMIVIIVCVSALTVRMMPRGQPVRQVAAPAAQESVYDRVMRTGTLRCGYAVWQPLFIKDPNSGQFSGIFYEYVEALGKSLGLKIVWDSEIGWADIPEALRSHKVDAMCNGIWASFARARVIDFTTPLYFNQLFAYARADDTRFDNNLKAANDPGVTISVMDGDAGSQVSAVNFPNAKNDQLTQLSDQSLLLLEVANGKADLTVTDSVTGAEYMAKNPGKIKQVISPQPLELFPNVIGIPAGEDKLRRMLDEATNELLYSGRIEGFIQKYEKYPGTLARVAKPYQDETGR